MTPTYTPKASEILKRKQSSEKHEYLAFTINNLMDDIQSKPLTIKDMQDTYNWMIEYSKNHWGIE